MAVILSVAKNPYPFPCRGDPCGRPGTGEDACPTEYDCGIRLWLILARVSFNNRPCKSIMNAQREILRMKNLPGIHRAQRPNLILAGFGADASPILDESLIGSRTRYPVTANSCLTGQICRFFQSGFPYRVDDSLRAYSRAGDAVNPAAFGFEPYVFDPFSHKLIGKPG